MLKKLLMLSLITISVSDTLAMDQADLQKKLIVACKTGNVQEAAQVIATGIDLSTKLSWMIGRVGIEGEDNFLIEIYEHNCSFLHLASGAGHSNIVTLLLDSGTEKDVRDGHDNTPLVWATKKGHSAVIELLAQAGANFDNTAGKWPPLHIACQKLDPELVSQLLRLGASTRILKNEISILNALFNAVLEKLDTLRTERLQKNPESFQLSEFESHPEDQFVEDSALAIIELLRHYGATVLDEYAADTDDNTFFSVATFNKRYKCSMIVPLLSGVRKAEARSQFLTFLSCIKRLGIPMPKDIKILLLCYMPVLAKYAGWQSCVVPVKMSEVVFRRKFLDEAWPLLPKLLNQKERSEMHQLLAKRNDEGAFAKDFTFDEEEKTMLDPVTWQPRVELENA